MPQPTECLRCRGRMERGLIVDRGDGNLPKAPQWLEGAARQRWWGGIDTKDRASFPVATWRCERCGWLESYAREADG